MTVIIYSFMRAYWDFSDVATVRIFLDQFRLADRRLVS